ncbi:hypothetical protein N9X24_00455 [Rickettsiales bacterium]|nr:hypothetical protein [Rickettsiales bacterium]
MSGIKNYIMNLEESHNSKDISEISIKDMICSGCISSCDNKDHNIFDEFFEYGITGKCDFCKYEDEETTSIENILKVIQNYFEKSYQAAEMCLGINGDVEYRGQGEEYEEILEDLLVCDDGLKLFIKENINIDNSVTYELISDANERYEQEIEEYYSYINGLGYSKIKTYFDANIDLVKDFVNSLQKDNTFYNLGLRMSFSQIISIMEKYFFDSFNHCLFSNIDNNYLLEKYFKIFKKNNKDKLNYVDLFLTYRNINKKIKEELYKTSFHNIDNIKKMISVIEIESDNIKTLDNNNINKMGTYVDKRHNFVHRVEYNKNNILVTTNKDEINDLIKCTEDLISEADKIMKNYLSDPRI